MNKRIKINKLMYRKIYDKITMYFQIRKNRMQIVCPLVKEREGGAHEHNGSFNLIACYICGIVIHRQQTQ